MCKHESIKLYTFDHKKNVFDTTKKGAGGFEDEGELVAEEWYILSGDAECLDCEKVLTDQEVADLTGLDVHEYKFDVVAKPCPCICCKDAPDNGGPCDSDCVLFLTWQKKYRPEEYQQAGSQLTNS